MMFDRFYVTAPFLLALAAYSSSLFGDFVYDDTRAILNNHDLRPETPWRKLLANDFWGTPMSHSGSHKSYRPLTVFTFRLNYYISRYDSSLSYHVVNLLLHAVVSSLVGITAHKLLRSGASLCGCLFAVHPVHTEAVAGLVGRAELLACFFFLLSFLAYLKSRGSSQQAISMRWLILSMVCAWSAMLSKEQGITVLGVIIAYEMLVRSRLASVLASYKRPRSSSSPTDWQAIIVLVVTASNLALALLFRAYIMGFTLPAFSPADNPIASINNRWTRLLTFSYICAFNAKLLVLPSALSFDWSMDSIQPVERIADSRNLLSLVTFSCIIVLVFILVKALLRLYRERNPVVESPSFPISPSASVRATFKIDHNANMTSLLPFEKACSCRRNESCATKQTHCRHTVLASATEAINPMSAQLTARSYREKFTGSWLELNFDDDRSTRLIRTLAFALLSMVLSFLPASNLFFYVGFVVAERVLYIPSVGYCLLVVMGYRLLLDAAGIEESVTEKATSTPSEAGSSIESSTSSRPSSSLSSGSDRVFSSWKLYAWLRLSVVLLLSVYACRTWLRSCDWKNEVRLYRSGLPYNPAKALANLGNVLSRQHRTVEAERAYREALSLRPNMADTHYNLGLLLQEQERYREAIDAYKNAILYRKRLALAYLNLGLVYSTLGDNRHAENTFRSCADLSNENLKDPIAHDSARLSCLYNLGRMLVEEGDYRRAIDAYQVAVSRLNGYYKPHSLFNMLGEAFLKLSETKNAEHWYRKSLTSKSDHIPAHLTYAHFLMAQKRFAEARELLVKAQRLAPDNAAVHQHLGQYYFETGDLVKCLDAYRVSNRLGPDNFATIFGLANVLRLLKQNLEAEVEYAKAVRLQPLSANAHMNYGAILHLNKKYADAEREYMKAIELNADDLVARENLRKLRNSMGK